MTTLFKKAAVFTDLHLGLKNNSIKHLDDCEAFVDWFVDLSKSKNCETCLFLGDWHHHRVSVNLQTLSYSLRCLEKLNQTFENVYLLPGNHDLFYREDRSIHGIAWAKHLPNIHLINDWFLRDDVSIVPWLLGDEYKKLSKIKAKYMFGHFELPHFRLNNMVTMPDNGTIQLDHLYGVEHVYSGHFHKRQFKQNVTYVGSPFAHDYSDTGDSDRGCMILDWGKDPEFHSWPDQPLYLQTTLSNLMDHGPDILKPKMSVQVKMDINVSYEESINLKEVYQNDYALRDMGLITIKDVECDDNKEATADIAVTSIDKMIVDQISALSSEYYDIDLLLQIYNDLL